jgi:hypothetical protein
MVPLAAGYRLVLIMERASSSSNTFDFGGYVVGDRPALFCMDEGAGLIGIQRGAL